MEVLRHPIFSLAHLFVGVVFEFEHEAFAIELSKLPDNGPGLVPVTRSERTPQITRVFHSSVIFALPLPGLDDETVDVHIERHGELVEPRERELSHAAFIERDFVLAYPRFLPQGAARESSVLPRDAELLAEVAMPGREM